MSLTRLSEGKIGFIWLGSGSCDNGNERPGSRTVSNGRIWYQRLVTGALQQEALRLSKKKESTYAVYEVHTDIINLWEMGR
jgi:hypothetical protein